LLALSVPLLAGLAVWAVVMRVGQYGLTPERVLAGAMAMVLLAYGLAYAVAALKGPRRWRPLLRRCNVWLALLVVAVCCAWMTPVLDADRLSVRSQLSRFADGRAEVEDLPLWPMAQDWGRAGQGALERLSAMTDRPDHAELIAGIEAARRRTPIYTTPDDPTRDELADMVQDLVRWVPVWPDGALPAGDLGRMPVYW
ncbi:unnamed protein product, partial [Ectocarpus sp. 12 AP-2014]